MSGEFIENINECQVKWLGVHYRADPTILSILLNNKMQLTCLAVFLYSVCVLGVEIKQFDSLILT